MATYDEVMESIISKQAQPSVALGQDDPRRVDPSHPYPATRWDGSQSIVGGPYPNPERGWMPRTYVPGSDPQSYGLLDEGDWGLPSGRDETAMQYRGQVEGLTPEVRQHILDSARTYDTDVDELIDIYGVQVVERVLREDIASGRFHSVGDARGVSDDDLHSNMLYNRRHRLGPWYGGPPNRTVGPGG